MLGEPHETAHADDLHHHEEDGSVHYDVSADSLEHADEHSACLQFSLLALNGTVFGAKPVSLGDYPDPASYLPNPFLDAPQRPPAFAPGFAAGG